LGLLVFALPAAIIMRAKYKLYCKQQMRIITFYSQFNHKCTTFIRTYCCIKVINFPYFNHCNSIIGIKFVPINGIIIIRDNIKTDKGNQFASWIVRCVGEGKRYLNGWRPAICFFYFGKNTQNYYTTCNWVLLPSSDSYRDDPV
jgi:hypothetical protein